MAYVNFVNHCYVDTEVEMKEIYTSNHIWTLFENFTLDMAQVRGEGWVGGTQQWRLAWGQGGVTMWGLGTLVAVTCGAGDRSELSGVATGAVPAATSLSWTRSQQPLGRHELSPVPSAPSLCAHRCARSGRNACQTPRWRSTC